MPDDATALASDHATAPLCAARLRPNGLRRVARRLLGWLICALALASPLATPLAAQDRTPDFGPAILLRPSPAAPVTPRTAPQTPRLVIRDDPGGPLRPRLQQVHQLRAQGTRVELRGQFCNSACTLLLGAGNVCVTPHTSFGFHGPHYLSGRMMRARFEHWSTEMAATYPPALRHWFMSKGRFARDSPLRLSGAQLIAMGIPAC